MSAEVAQNILTLPQMAPLNVFQRVNEIRKKVAYAKKDKTVEGQGSYKVVTHDAVTALLRNQLIEHGIVIVPRLISSSVTDIGKTKSGASIIRYAARYDVDFVNCDNPDDKIAVPVEAHANDSGDKAPGKAMSYATKSAMLKLFSIETGENEESRVEPYEAIKRVSEEQAANIEALLDEVKADRPKFLKWMEAESVSDIRARDYDEAIKALEAKRKA